MMILFIMTFARRKSRFLTKNHEICVIHLFGKHDFWLMILKMKTISSGGPGSHDEEAVQRGTTKTRKFLKATMFATNRIFSHLQISLKDPSDCYQAWLSLACFRAFQMMRLTQTALHRRQSGRTSLAFSVMKV